MSNIMKNYSDIHELCHNTELSDERLAEILGVSGSSSVREIVDAIKRCHLSMLDPHDLTNDFLEQFHGVEAEQFFSRVASEFLDKFQRVM